ncbi:hypothetical protein QF043_003142 [Pseudomonas sp. W3I7]|nr:hypothetical protein [Pseudomonas sp. W3I7]
MIKDSPNPPGPQDYDTSTLHEVTYWPTQPPEDGRDRAPELSSGALSTDRNRKLPLE